MAAKIVITILAVLIGIAAGATFHLGVSARTRPFTDATGAGVPGSIASLERIRLGGMDQWILIRGADRTRPVLLWLHGGPGGAQMPFAHALDGPLEQHFVVVHWDQRGAGKSNPRTFDVATMRLDRYLGDALELIEHLRHRFGQDRIVLVGHSWGSRLGLELVRTHPDLFSAYVGVSQVVDHGRATEIARDWLLETLDPVLDREDREELNEIQVPAFRHGEFRRLNRLTTAHGGSLDLGMTQVARIVAGAPEYTVADYVRLLRGFSRGGGPMHRDGIMEGYNYIETTPVLAVPVYFFMGARDYNTPLALVREYLEVLDAPRKELVVFEHSAHQPFLSEPERFMAELIRVAGGGSGDSLTPRSPGRPTDRAAAAPHRSAMGSARTRTRGSG